MTREQDAFIAAFFEALFWSEGEAFYDLSYTDLEDDDAKELISDCLGFLSEASTLLAKTSLTFESAGHDFLLTRNGHGAGFWDRGLGDIGDKLTGMAHNYGTIGLDLGDNGQVYVHN